MEWLGLLADHIFEKVSPAMEALGMECKCLGGGKIEHNSQEKKLRVFGESTVSSPDMERRWIKNNQIIRNALFSLSLIFQGFGKADHSVSVEKLKGAFSDYEITWSDDKK